MAGEYVTTHVAAKLLRIGNRQVQRMCSMRELQTAYKPGIGKQAQWRILRTEVIQRIVNQHAQPYQ